MHSNGISLLQEIIIVLTLSVLVILTFQRFKLPTILGFLITGMIAGPYGLSLIKASEEVELLSEIGVILLLFVIGLEFSLTSLNAIRKTVFLGGTTQVSIVILIVLGISYLVGFSFPESIFLGFLIALSSTAIVLKVLQDTGQMNSPHGKISLAILIYQDIIVVPMMLFTPMIAGQSDSMVTSILWLVLKIVILIILVIFSARFVVPRLLHLVAQARNRELFVLTIIGLCFSVAFLTSYVGLSLALGAFMAGLIISESEYSHQAISEVLPFREIFTSIFFISVGMLVDIGFLFSHIAIILPLVTLVILIKLFAGAAAAMVLRFPFRTVTLTAFSIFQVGEFSFILSKTGTTYGLISGEVYQYFLAVSVITMGLTPFVIKDSERLCTWLGISNLGKKLDKKRKLVPELKPSEQEVELKDHLVIIGYGVNGKNTAAAAKAAGIPYIIIELNPDTVKAEKEKGEPIIYGDAVYEHILYHAKIYAARVAVVAISDPEASKKIIVSIRHICRTVYIITRTKFVKDVSESMKLGANEVVPEELETSIEVFSRVLGKYLVHASAIASFVEGIRSEELSMVRPLHLPSTARKAAFDIPDSAVIALSVDEALPRLIGKSIEQLGLRERFGITILAIKRNDDFNTELKKNTVIESEDIIYFFGKQEKLTQLNNQELV